MNDALPTVSTDVGQSLASLGSRHWDAIVVGAGPAGVIAARQVAGLGQSVLLVDKASFPRPKVCGGCLNLSMLSTLDRVGLRTTIDELGGAPIHAMQLSAGQHSATLALPGGISVSRQAMDWALIQEAVRSGVTFLPATRAAWSEPKPGQGVDLDLQQDGQVVPQQASVVVLANGLAGMATSEALQVDVQAASLLGTGSLLGHEQSHASCFDDYAPGVIYMLHGTAGYVGIVRVESGRLNIAAALQPKFVTAQGGLGQAVAQIVSASGSAGSESLTQAEFQGTPILTRRANRIAGNRFLVVGDAAGYIEPFTGEGMAWAALGGEAVAGFVSEGCDDWSPELETRWTQAYAKLVTSRQRLCRQIAWLLKQPTLSQLAIRVLDRYPRIANPVIHRLNDTLRS